eukprot:Selendium_serpulae@DN10888_c0_g1_i1.p1
MTRQYSLCRIDYPKIKIKQNRTGRMVCPSVYLSVTQQGGVPDCVSVSQSVSRVVCMSVCLSVIAEKHWEHREWESETMERETEPNHETSTTTSGSAKGPK